MANHRERRLRVLEATAGSQAKRPLAIIIAIGKPPEQVECELAELRACLLPGERVIILDM